MFCYSITLVIIKVITEINKDKFHTAEEPKDV